MQPIRTKNTLLTIAMMVLIAGIAILGIPSLDRDNAEATVSVYGVAQGVEMDLSHWPGGFQSRGINNVRFQVGTVTMDESYPTGGETLDLSGTFPNAVLFCVFAPQNGYTFEYVHGTASAPATGLIKGYIGDGTEIESGADVSNFVVEYLAIGW